MIEQLNSTIFGGSKYLSMPKLNAGLDAGTISKL